MLEMVYLGTVQTDNSSQDCLLHGSYHGVQGVFIVL